MFIVCRCRKWCGNIVNFINYARIYSYSITYATIIEIPGQKLNNYNKIYLKKKNGAIPTYRLWRVSTTTAQLAEY